MEQVGLIVKRLKHSNISAVSRETGLSYKTVYNIVKEKGRKPHIRTIQKLIDYMEAN